MMGPPRWTLPLKYSVAGVSPRSAHLASPALMFELCHESPR